MLIVQKFGGTSLMNTDRLRTAALRVMGRAARGDRVVVVVSAQGHTTDRLIEEASAVCKDAPRREMDAYIAAGEQLSAGLMAMTLIQLGQPAVSLQGWQAGLFTDGTYGNATVLGLLSGRVRRELDSGKVVVVAGFQGINEAGDITTLGRGGSDTTAVALAAALKADRCQIFTDVDGVYDRDPRKYPGAVRFGRISYEKMMDLIENGAQVLHDRSVELARDAGIRIEVLSAFTGIPGTIVG